MATNKNDLINNNSAFAWVVLGTAAVLSVPAAAMLFKWEGWDWGPLDFIIMGTLVFVFGTLYVLTARVVSRQYRILVAAAHLIAFLYIWAELAVGVFFK